jgi:hypothetical protein
MKTDNLIAMLSTNVERVDRGQVERTISTAIGTGSAIAFIAMLVVFGVRGDFGDRDALIFLALKLVFTIAVVVASTLYLVRLARPGTERTRAMHLAMFPFIVMVLLAAASLGLAPTAHWKRMLLGDQWLECLVSIPLIAIAPFAGIVWAVRRMAPTDLTRAGMVAGIVAGSMSATGYVLHCTDDFLPFIALWYGGTIALCGFIGAGLGPRLLRW